MNGKELANDIPADVLTRNDFSSGTRNVRRPTHPRRPRLLERSVVAVSYFSISSAVDLQ
jgi:hypothetical protein